MLVYILKSAACLAILVVFYKLFLEKESIHRFKRFYLLGALVFSLLVPALVFTEYVEVAPKTTNIAFVTPDETVYSKDAIQVPQALDKDRNDIAPILWTVYFIGMFYFGLKFLRNLFHIFRRIQRNPKYKLNQFTQVLLQEKITPHTFFSYIFLNRTRFEANQIPKEVLLHEETHAQQKHSWDVVFVELLQVIFWVNPLIYLAKNAIKLNHEFLADQAVLDKNIDETTYKNTLLSYLSPDSENKYQPMANAINYSSIKKRFTIMKTHTSKRAIYLRTLLLMPLMAVLLYGFSETKVIEVNKPDSTEILDKASYQEVVSYNELAKKYNAVPIEKRKIPISDLKVLETVFRKMSANQKSNAQPFPECLPQNKNSQDGASRKLMAEYKVLAKKYNTMLAESKSIQIKKQDVERLEYIYSLMSEKQKADAEPFPDFPLMPDPPAAPKAPNTEKTSKVKKAEKSDKNNWVVASGANRDSRLDKNGMPVPPVAPTIAVHANKKKYSKELHNAIQDYLKKNKMYEESVSSYLKKGKGNRQNLWNMYNEAMELYVTYYDLARKEDNFIPPMPPKAPKIQKDEVSSIPPPPEPQTPLDHVIEMAKKDAVFYYEGEKIPSDKAIELLKNNKNLNIDSRGHKGRRPEVRISKNPIKIEK